jgi:hypothetical protein
MIQQVKKAIIKRFIKLGQYAIDSLGGETKAFFASPKGLYSRPRRADALCFQILGDEGNKFAMPLQDPISLKEGQVALTDGKSLMIFNFTNGKVELTTADFIVNGVSFLHHTHPDAQGGDTGEPK